MDSKLYINGEFAGEWKYGYSSFEHDITQFSANLTYITKIYLNVLDIR
ncbi:MAG TPA: hypothetical protein GX723_07015 [Thermoanaerobacterales bacterium]|jgi:hypothetical protein|nr:hypothetical protein [Thermoanaerobacterales bacterium]